ncbi:MAG: phosphoribosylamine--glycine ligase [Proteobacteria bacterium]|nr:phosphoribosylamine--glycine ligase [Pseudomonadota bacterium]
MKVMVVGSGGREHALAWKLAGEDCVDKLLAAPGSAAIAQCAECLPVAADDVEGLVSVALERGVDLVLVGPEQPLAAGLVDLGRERGLKVFGPGRDGAQLESSKAFTKTLLDEAGVATARWAEFTQVAPARAFAEELGLPVVVKADGLAAGKGVVICEDAEQVDEALISMLEGGRFGEAGARVVVEEFMCGEELSFIALTDGRTVLPLATSQDHKAVFDGDKGPNTGGMGAYSPAPVCDQAMQALLLSDVLEPTVAALAARGIDYRGVLYAGIMVTDEGPKVLEYNVRFGDPECQPLMMRMRGSLAEAALACVEGTLDRVRLDWADDAAACVVMTAPGYPGEYSKGDVIEGIAAANELDDVKVFEAGTSRDDDGRVVSSGGRVLGVTSTGGNIAAALHGAYSAVSAISWPGAHYRRDIGHRALDSGASA